MVCTTVNLYLHPLILGSTVDLRLRYWNFDPVLGQQRQMYVPQLLPQSSVILMSISATPTIEYFSQGTAIYMGGDSAAFFARYPAPIIPLVSHIIETSLRVY